MIRVLAFGILMLPGVMVQPSWAQSTPHVVQAATVPFSGALDEQVPGNGLPTAEQKCVWTLDQAIGSGDTIVGYVHSENNHDNVYMAPRAIVDNNGMSYTLTPPVSWQPWNEAITIFYLTNIQGNPTSFTFDFTQYPATEPTILGPCNFGLVEYSGVTSVTVAGPTQSGEANPAIEISPTAPALIWAFAADVANISNQNTDLLQNSGFSTLLDNWATDNIMVWGSSDLIQTSPVTLTVYAPGGDACFKSIVAGGCPTVLAAVALQGAHTAQDPPPAAMNSPKQSKAKAAIEALCKALGL